MFIILFLLIGQKQGSRKQGSLIENNNQTKKNGLGWVNNNSGGK